MHVCTCCGMLVEVTEEPVPVVVLLPCGSQNSNRSQDWQKAPLCNHRTIVLTGSLSSIHQTQPSATA